jgi:hypothetical protein
MIESRISVIPIKIVSFCDPSPIGQSGFQSIIERQAISANIFRDYSVNSIHSEKIQANALFLIKNFIVRDGKQIAIKPYWRWFFLLSIADDVEGLLRGREKSQMYPIQRT